MEMKDLPFRRRPATKTLQEPTPGRTCQHVKSPGAICERCRHPRAVRRFATGEVMNIQQEKEKNG